MADDSLGFSPSSPMVTTPRAMPPESPFPSDDQGTVSPLSPSRAPTHEKEIREAIGRAEKSMEQEDILGERRVAEDRANQSRYKAMADQGMIERHDAYNKLRDKRLEEPRPPQRDDQPAQNQWLSATMMIGALAGALTRRHATNALAAMTGMLQGYSEGSQQKFQDNMKIWEAERTRVLDSNQAALDDYKNILENKKLDMDQMSIELQMAAQTHKDEAMATVAKTNNSLHIAQLWDTLDKNQATMMRADGQLKLEAQELKRQQFQRDAQDIVRSTPEIIDSMMKGLIEPPSRTPRETTQGYVDRERWAELARRGYDETIWNRRRSAAVGEAGTVARAGANIDIVMRSAGPVIERAAAAAQAVPVTAFPQLNKLIQQGAALVGDPALRNFQLANMELARTLARALNPRSNQITNYMLKEAEDIISTADSPEAYQRVLAQIKATVEREHQAVQEQREGKDMPPIDLPDSTQRRLQPTPRQIFPATPGAFGGTTRPTPDNPVPAATSEPIVTTPQDRGISAGRGLGFEPIFDPFGLRGWKGGQVQ